MPLIYRIGKPLVTLFLLFSCRWEVQKESNPFPRGPLIIVANHLSNFDILFLGVVFFPRRISFMAKEELFHSPFQSFLFRHLGSFPVHRGQVDRKAIYKASERLKEGWALGLFPEGTRSPSAQLLPAQPGTALIALRNDAHILPVGITGTEKIKERIKDPPSRLFHRPLVTVHIGKPFKLLPAEGKLTRDQLDSFTELIMRELAELLPESYRGVYKEGGKGDEKG